MKWKPCRWRHRMSLRHAHVKMPCRWRHRVSLRHAHVKMPHPATSRQSKIHRTEPCVDTHYLLSWQWLRQCWLLKALFKISDDKLTFRNAAEVVVETEGATKVGKESVYRSRASAITVPALKMGHETEASSGQQHNRKPAPAPTSRRGPCLWCGKRGYFVKDCWSTNATCHFCQKTGHLKVLCRQKEMSKRPVDHPHDPNEEEPPSTSHPVGRVHIPCQDPVVQQLHLNGKSFGFGADSGTKIILWTTSAQDLDDQLCFSNKECRIRILGTF